MICKDGCSTLPAVYETTPAIRLHDSLLRHARWLLSTVAAIPLHALRGTVLSSVPASLRAPPVEQAGQYACAQPYYSHPSSSPSTFERLPSLPTRFSSSSSHFTRCRLLHHQVSSYMAVLVATFSMYVRSTLSECQNQCPGTRRIR